MPHLSRFDKRAMLISTIIVAASSAALQVPASAQTHPVIEPLNKCVTLPDPFKRLTCFDEAMVNARKAAEQELGLRPGTSISSSKDRNFGRREQSSRAPSTRASALKDAEFGRSRADVNRQQKQAGTPEKAPDTLNSTLVSHSYDIYGKLRVTLANGQIWQSTGTSEFRRLPKGEPTVTITKSVFGGYRMKINGVTGREPVKRVD